MMVSIYAASPLILERMRMQLSPTEFQVHAYLVSARECATAPVPACDAFGVDVHEPALRYRLLPRLPRPCLLVVDAVFAPGAAFSLLLEGVRGFVRYDRIEQELTLALRTLRQGGYWAPHGLMSAFLDRLLTAASGPRRGASTTRLSPREQQVLAGVLEQLTNPQIAARLAISERTVKFHISNLLRRFDVHKREQLALHARPIAAGLPNLETLAKPTPEPGGAGRGLARLPR